MREVAEGRMREENRGGHYYGVCAVGGVLSAGTTHLVITPLDVLKVNMQVNPIKYNSIYSCFTTLLREQGPSAFWRGWSTKFFGYGAQVSMVMFSTFEHSVDFLYRNVIRRRKEECSKVQQLGVTCLAGYAAGAVGSFISNPADNIVASINNKKADSLRLAIRNIGFANLFTRSLPIRIILVGPVVTLQWLFYDTIKILSGLPTSGEVSADPARENTRD